MKDLTELKKELSELKNEIEEKKILREIEILKRKKEKFSLEDKRKENRDEENVLKALKRKGPLTKTCIFGQYVQSCKTDKDELLKKLLLNNKIKEEVKDSWPGRKKIVYHLT